MTPRPPVGEDGAATKIPPIGVDGVAARTLLAEAALHELRTREVAYPQQIAQGKRDAGEAGRTLAAWRAIVDLLRTGTAEIEACLAGGDPALAAQVGPDGAAIRNAWPCLVAAAHAAAEHRLRVALKSGAQEAEQQMVALRRIRDHLTRSAIRQGAQLPSFDAAPVGMDGPRNEVATKANAA